MFRFTQVKALSENIAGFITPFLARSEPALARIPIRVDRDDVPQRLSSRRRKSRVSVNIHGV